MFRNDISGLGEIGKKYNFWVKTDKLWSTNIFTGLIPVINHKCSFNMQNPMSGLGEIGQNDHFWVKTDKFW